MSDDEARPTLTYDERQAISVLRKAIMRGRPQVIEALMKGLPIEVGARALKSVSTELNSLLAVTRVFKDATESLIRASKL